MPERPELEYVVGVLSRELPGAEITAAMGIMEISSARAANRTNNHARLIL